MDNPCPFSHKFSFEITFECCADLAQDLEWKVLYVGSAESSEYDQVLEEVEVGPVPQGLHKFVLESPAPDVSKLPQVLGVTVVLVTCTYREQEFVRIGYYVNNEVPGMNVVEEGDSMQQQSNLDLSTIVRTILADKPRVTRFPIQWDSCGDENATPLKQQQQQQQHEDAMETCSSTMEISVQDTNSHVSMDAAPMIVSPPSTQTSAMQI